jgi:cellulose synthase/poly-beta-1,6-N-acetylglucosamine synthase-like glycosyltransferase
MVCAHNEENVIADILKSILEVDYPTDNLQVIIVNDRSTDKTADIIEEFVQSYPSKFIHYHRKEGTPGKAAALADAAPLVQNAITLIFDADYLPGQHLIKSLVAPFFDPEVGAVMGRVIPGNVDINLLTRLIDMERCGGYQVNQQARENLHLVPQYGGTAGGVRTQALNEVGGWNPDYLAEDTEITFRLLSHNWLPVYQNNAECIELAPETWPVRIRQLKRWTKGHNQVLFTYFWKTLLNKNLRLWARLDGVLLLFTFCISPVLLLGWIIFMVDYFFNTTPGLSSIFQVIMLISFIGIGNFTIFFEIATAVHLDNLRDVEGKRIRLLPFAYLHFFVSMFCITMALIEQLTIDKILKKGIVWHRTEHVTRTPSSKADEPSGN